MVKRGLAVIKNLVGLVLPSSARPGDLAHGAMQYVLIRKPYRNEPLRSA